MAYENRQPHYVHDIGRRKILKILGNSRLNVAERQRKVCCVFRHMKEPTKEKIKNDPFVKPLLEELRKNAIEMLKEREVERLMKELGIRDSKDYSVFVDRIKAILSSNINATKKCNELYKLLKSEQDLEVRKRMRELIFKIKDEIEKGTAK